jgi:hypothetical protein
VGGFICAVSAAGGENCRTITDRRSRLFIYRRSNKHQTESRIVHNCWHIDERIGWLQQEHNDLIALEAQRMRDGRGRMWSRLDDALIDHRKLFAAGKVIGANARRSPWACMPSG